MRRQLLRNKNPAMNAAAPTAQVAFVWGFAITPGMINGMAQDVITTGLIRALAAASCAADDGQQSKRWSARRWHVARCSLECRNHRASEGPTRPSSARYLEALPLAAGSVLLPEFLCVECARGTSNTSQNRQRQ